MKSILNSAKLAVDAVVLAGSGSSTKILVIKRKNAPFKGEWSLPGGLLDPYESPWEGVIRELREETGLDLPEHEGIALTPRSKKGRDPRGWIISFPYLFWLEKEGDVKGGDDAEKAKFIPLEKLEQLSFDHGAILCEALGRFWKIFSANPSFSYLPGGTPWIYGAPCPGDKDWIIYGGTFNPWHEGHDHCVRMGTTLGHETSDSMRNLLVIPDRNPFKDFSPTSCSWKFYQELRKKLEPYFCYVYPGFCGQERPNPTYQWQILSLGTCSLLMGDDSFINLPKWLHPELLLSHLKRIFVVPRIATPEELKKTSQWIKNSQPRLEIITLLDHPYKDHSSTKLRSPS